MGRTHEQCCSVPVCALVQQMHVRGSLCGHVQQSVAHTLPNTAATAGSNSVLRRSGVSMASDGADRSPTIRYPSRSRSLSPCLSAPIDIESSPHAATDIESPRTAAIESPAIDISSPRAATSCPACAECHARIHELEKQIQDLRRRLRESQELVNELMVQQPQAQ